MKSARYHRDYYSRNAETIKANRRTRDTALRREQREFVSQHKAMWTCADCGENDPIVLDLDHRDPKTKRNNVSNMCGKVSWDTLRTEIGKCDVRCANCHRRKTYASEV